MRQTGYTTLDPGFVNTAATKSAITYIDGDQGILRYRGYAIEDLAKNSTYLEVAWLLIYGELPSPSELAEFDEKIRRHTLLHEDLKRFFYALPHTAHPMSVLSAAVSALSTYYEDSLDPHDPEQVEISTIRLLAKLPVIAAYAHKKSARPRVPLPGQLVELRRQLPQAQLRQPRRAVRGQPRAASRRSIACSSCTRTTSRTRRPRRCGSSDRPRRTCSPPSPRASTPSTARSTAAPTRPCSGCSPRSATPARASAEVRRTSQEQGGGDASSWASGIASTRASTRAPRSSRRAPTRCSRTSA